ncbi:unnamed protein product, partial [Polarella glacialis]
VLCPDPLVSSIMGHRGSTIHSIEDESPCKLKVSGRDQLYPGTRLRVVTIHADDSDAILRALDRILDLHLELAESERENPSQRTAVHGEPDFVGKDPGEFVFRTVVPVRVGSAVIGPRGANIQALKEETGARVLIDKNHQAGSQMLRLF